MKCLLFSVGVFFFSFLEAGAQEYRLVYESASLPELYNSVDVFAEIKDGTAFKRLPQSKYRLSVAGASLDGHTLNYNREQLYSNNGVIHFLLRTGGRDIPLTLQLPVLEDIQFNLYTDSIKPILNYYLNVEGRFSSGRVLPLDAGFVTVSSDAGSMSGLEWVPPAKRDFDRVNFTVTNKFNPAQQKQVTVYLKKYKDPRDNMNYRDRTEEEVIHNRRR